MNNILVIGSVALDSIATPAGKAKEILGGSATFFSASASFFTKVNLVATIGEDFSHKHQNAIASFGVDLTGLEIKKGRTFRWEGSYIDDINCAKTINTQLNVFAEFKPAIPKSYAKSKNLFLANIDPDLQLFILKNWDNKGVIGCDSMNLWIQNKKSKLKKLISKTNFMFLNDGEAKLLSGESNIIKAGKYIMSLGPKFCIIKRGEYGAVVFDKNGPLSVAPACLLENVCDPTGAGDSFAGGFMGYLTKTSRINSESIRKALLYGTIMASFAVENFSIKRFIGLKKKDIEKRLKNFNKLTINCQL